MHPSLAFAASERIGVTPIERSVSTESLLVLRLWPPVLARSGRSARSARSRSSRAAAAAALASRACMRALERVAGRDSVTRSSEAGGAGVDAPACGRSCRQKHHRELANC